MEFTQQEMTALWNMLNFNDGIVVQYPEDQQAVVSGLIKKYSSLMTVNGQVKEGPHSIDLTTSEVDMTRLTLKHTCSAPMTPVVVALRERFNNLGVVEKKKSKTK